MYFKKLELVGFKSFLEKTILNFEPGITAIVGPNGCGKSNLFDAIRWVLGEQSVKAMRGSEMQDVIFSGTDSKESLSMAEVTLAFDNDKRFFNIDHSEVSITRRIFRSGESEYLLNKTQVRLKDILDILLGTGIGAESYSMVAQGKIDLILSSRPEDRRLVFDEAAGITKYKAQKKEAQKKLEETEQNLLRVNDIILEVKRQIGSLERQANKARRYKEIFEELKTKEINLSILQTRKLFSQKDELIQEINILENQELALLNTVKGQEAKISNYQMELKELQDRIMAIKNEISNLENLEIRNKDHIEFNQERIVELENNQRYLITEIQQAKSRLLLDKEKLNTLREAYESTHRRLSEKTIILREKQKELTTITSSIRLSLEKVSRAKKDILGLVKKNSSIKNEITEASGKQQVFLARKKRLEIEKAKINEEKSITEENLSNITQEWNAMIKNSEDLNLKLSGLNKELEGEVLSLNGLNKELQILEKERLTLQSHKEFVEKLKTKYEDISESLQAVIYLDKLPNQRLTGLVVKINNIEASASKVYGEAKPIDLDLQKINQKIKEIEENLDTLKNTKNTKEGKIEQLNKILEQLQQDLRVQEIALAKKNSQVATVKEHLDKIREEQELTVMELLDVEKELIEQDRMISELKSSLAKLEQEESIAEDTITSEQNSIVSKSGLKEEALVIIAQTETELEVLTKRTHSDETTLMIWQDSCQREEQSLIDFERKVKENQEKKASLDLEIKDLQNKINEEAQVSENKNVLLKETEDNYQGISACAGRELKKIDWDRTELGKLKNKLYELEMRNKELDFKILSIKDKILQIYKVELAGAPDLTAEITSDVLLEEVPRLKEKLAGAPDLTVEIASDVLLEEVQRLKEKLDSQGTVNLVAIEEYDELKKRYDFLIQQQTDLLSAKGSLHEAILKINRTTKKIFLEIFSQVAEEFRNYFRLLFNGGDAQLFLIDEQDPLESGIEIICRPPGKKLQNILLLSGGEKALSAIALLFAIFKVKPCPFCILDEIDAALDEANVDRFARLLQEFAQESQFIVITHNKRTIVNADVMYGITMEESGVSKIVSVKFAQDQEKEKEQIAVAGPV